MTKANGDIEGMAEPGGAANEQPVFQAMLMPHRSLGRTGFIILMVLASAVAIVHAVMFVATGAWPVSVFFGLDLALLAGAFWLNYRSGRAREEVSVSRTRLAIRKFAPSGRVTEHAFNPFWARFRVARHAEIGITAMSVSGEGRTTDVGSFLNPDDRESFAAAFSGALASLRRP